MTSVFCGVFSEHRVERRVVVYHQPTFQPIASLVAFVECVFANTFTFRSHSWAQLSVEVSTNDRDVFLVVRHVSLDSFVHLFDVVVRILRVWENTHSSIQCDGG